ncbi:MAG: hypothetical protein C0490_20820, partial [Marivirga sp.]|nr:hypothetical protein [Marivirga sp.]
FILSELWVKFWEMLKYNIAVLAGALTFILLACNGDRKEELTNPSNPQRILYPNNGISKSLDSIRPPMQHFTINAETDTLLTSLHGTFLALSENTFVDLRGEIVTGIIDLDIVEVRSPGEILRAGLQTVSGDRILQTSGMLFIDATCKGQPVFIRDGRSITLNMNAKSRQTDEEIFSGEFDKNGRINWTKSGSIEKTFFSLPLDLLDFNYGAWECWYNNKQLAKLKNEKYADTFISTSEFETRMNIFNYYATCPQMKDLDDIIIGLYTDNLDRNLSYCDSLVAVHLRSNYGTLIDTTAAFNFGDSGWISLLYRYALKFANQKLTRPIDFDKLGISDNSTVQELTRNGVSEREASNLINLYKIRNKIIQSRKDEKETRDLATYTFSIAHLGWVNVDRFVDDPLAKESDFTVKINSEDSLNAISVSLFIVNYSVTLMATSMDGRRYSFTEIKEGYRKLPVGDSAVIVALSSQVGKPYWGLKRIKIPESGTVDLVIKPATFSHIEGEIAKLEK